MILLDTHVAIWLANDDPKLGAHSRNVILTAQEENLLAISAISFWEIALLASKDRLELRRSPAQLRNDLLNTGVTELPVTGAIAIAAVDLENLHADPADRFIVATAAAHGAILVTADKALLRWRHKLPRQSAEK